MSNIIFWGTPKDDLPHYSYIFKNLDLLGVELRNVVCYGLGTMLYL